MKKLPVSFTITSTTGTATTGNSNYTNWISVATDTYPAKEADIELEKLLDEEEKW
jgi:hypothetical protein